MAALLAELRPSYDVIIVDAPPVGAGADALALGTLTGNVLFVLRTGSTDRDLTENRLDMLERLPLRILGAVLNDVPTQKGYYYNKYDAYLPGYESKDEEGVVSATPNRVESVSAHPEVEEDGSPLVGQVAETTRPGAGRDRSNGGLEDSDGDDGKELHRRHQRHNQLRQWK